MAVPRLLDMLRYQGLALPALNVSYLQQQQQGAFIPSTGLLFPISRHQHVLDNAMLHARHGGGPLQEGAGVGDAAGVKLLVRRSEGAAENLQQDVAGRSRVVDGPETLSVEMTVGAADFGGHNDDGSARRSISMKLKMKK